MEGTLELDSSVQFSHGSMLTVNAPGPDAESGISRKLVSVTDGHALSLSEGVHKEIIRYAEGKDADGNRIYRDIDVYGGITLNVQGSDRWQMLLTGLDSSSLTGTFFDTDKFTYYVWQGNAARLHGRQCMDGRLFRQQPVGGRPDVSEWRPGSLLRHEGLVRKGHQQL